MSREGPDRANLGRELPGAYAAVGKLDQEAHQAALRGGFQEGFLELLRLRASQLNGCAFCLRLHARRAVEAGENADRLAVLAAWQETGYFDDRERAALAIVEAVTRIDDHSGLDRAYEAARGVLGADEAVAVSWVAVAINAYNRIAIASKYDVSGRASS